MNEVVKELMPYLEKIASKLESSATALWQLQMAQVKVVLIAGLTQYIALLIFWILWLIVCKHLHTLWCRYEEQGYVKDELDNKTFGFVTLPFASAVFAIGYYVFKVPSITEIFTLFYNPEYWALHELLRMVK